MEETDLVAVSVEASNDKESSKEDEEGKKAVKQRRLVLLGSCIVIVSEHLGIINKFSPSLRTCFRSQFTTAPFITVFTLLYRRKLVCEIHQGCAPESINFEIFQIIFQTSGGLFFHVIILRGLLDLPPLPDELELLQQVTIISRIKISHSSNRLETQACSPPP